jgi:hypothetical protein
VAVRLVLMRHQRERLRTPPSASRLMLSPAARAHSLLDVAPATVKKLQEVLAIIAQQFCGCVFDQQVTEVRGFCRRPCLQDCNISWAAMVLPY